MVSSFDEFYLMFEEHLFDIMTLSDSQRRG